ncbi:MAG: ARMT1-like domain-containing protein [Candidatus Bathyarchaeia archaeon]
MKINFECALCLFHRGYMEIIEATEDPKLRFEAARQLLNFLAENLSPEAVPAILGTFRDRIIKRVTGNPDPYLEKKRLSNIEAMKILPLADKIISEGGDDKSRFRRACLCAIAGNTIEFNIPGHEFGFEDLGSLLLEAERSLAIDDIFEAFSIAKKSNLIVYLTDNAGEIALDTLLVRELKRLGGRVIVAVKGEPVYNDATMDDALFVGMDRVADKVITTGSDTMGLITSECSEEFMETYKSADFVVAKGMGNAETLTEMDLTAPHLLLLKAKCMNVARYFGVERGKSIAKLLYPRKPNINF